MAALDGKSILDNLVEQLLINSSATTQTLHKFNELHATPAHAYALSQAWRNFQQTSQPLLRIHRNHRTDLQTALRKSTDPSAADFTDLLREIIGINGNGTELDGRTRDNSAFINALSQVIAQGNQQYQMLLLETQAAEAAILAFLGPDNMAHSDVVEARSNEHVRERGPHINKMCLAVQTLIDEVCNKRSNLDILARAFSGFKWPATPSVMALSPVQWHTHFGKFWTLWLAILGTNPQYSEDTQDVYSLLCVPLHLYSRLEKYRTDLTQFNNMRPTGTNETVHSAARIFAIMQDMPIPPQPAPPATHGRALVSAVRPAPGAAVREEMGSHVPGFKSRTGTREAAARHPEEIQGHCPVPGCPTATPAPGHTPLTCSRLPANHGVLPPRRCIKCDSTAHAFYRCNATDAVKAAFALTPAGRRIFHWYQYSVGTPAAVVFHARVSSHPRRRYATAMMDTAANITLVTTDVTLRNKRPCKGTARGIGSALPLLESGILDLVAGANGIQLQAFTYPGDDNIVSIPQTVDNDATLGVLIPPATAGQHVLQILRPSPELIFQLQRDSPVLLTASQDPSTFLFHTVLPASAPATPVLRETSQLSASHAPTSPAVDSANSLAYVSQAFLRAHQTFLDLHVQLWHASPEQMRKILRARALDHLPAESSVQWPPANWSCEVCLLTKIEAADFAAQAPAHHDPQRRGQKFYADIIFLEDMSFLHCRDGWSRHNTLDLGDKKNAATNFLLSRLHAAHCRDRDQGGIEELHVDLDNCLLNDETRAYCLREGIRIVPYAPHAPDAHGMVENPHKYLWQLYRIAKHSYRDITGAELPLLLRRYAMQHSVQGVNSMLSHADSQTPHELRFDRKPSLDYPFGQRGVAHLRPTPANKGADRGILATYLGKEEGSDHLCKVQVSYRTKTGKIADRVLTARTWSPVYNDTPGPTSNAPHQYCEEKDYPVSEMQQLAADLWTGKNSNACVICSEGGELLLCSFCSNSFHPECLHVRTSDLPVHYRCPTCCNQRIQVRTILTRLPAPAATVAVDPTVGARSDTLRAGAWRRLANGILRHEPGLLPLTPSRACVWINAWHQRRRLAISDPARAASLHAHAKQVNTSWRRLCNRIVRHHEDATPYDHNVPRLLPAVESRQALILINRWQQRRRSNARPGRHSDFSSDGVPSATTDDAQAITSIVTHRQLIAEYQAQHTAGMDEADFLLLPLTSVERRRIIRNSDLAHRRDPEAHGRRISKQEKTLLYSLRAALKQEKRQRTPQRTAPDALVPIRSRLQNLVDKLLALTPVPDKLESSEPVARVHRTVHEDTRAAEGDNANPFAYLGTLQVPIGGVGSQHEAWVFHTAAQQGSPIRAQDLITPANYNAARASPQWPQWRAAIQAEITQLRERHVFSTVDASESSGHISLGMTWSFKVKNTVDDTGTAGLKFKARLNVRGDQQKDTDINPDHRASPTADIESIRMMIATVAGTPSAEWLKFDMVAAFLNAKLDPKQAPIYMHCPQGMHDVGAGKMLLLNTNIYGLVEAAYLWFMDLSTTLVGLGWVQGIYDKCVFRRASPEGMTYLVLHVDDGLMGGRHTQRYYDELAAKYEMKNLGCPDTFLGMELHHLSDGRILVHAEQYIKDLLAHWARHPDHPMDVLTAKETKHTPLHKQRDMHNHSCKATVDEHWYHEFVGQMTHLAVIRPDLAFAVLLHSQGTLHQTTDHHEAARDLLIYLRDHATRGCLYGTAPAAPHHLITASDADFGANRVTGRAHGGYNTMLKAGLVAGKAATQSTVTTNTFESESQQLSTTGKNVLKLRHYQEHDFGIPDTLPSTVFVDNEAVQAYSRNVALTRSARHLTQAHHYGRQIYRDGLIDIKITPSAENSADIHTKALSRRTFDKHCRAMGMYSLEELASHPAAAHG